MSRAAIPAKTTQELESMTLDQLNAELSYLQTRRDLAGTSAAAKPFEKRIAAVLKARERNFGVVPRG